jgi:hypothetical protein
MGKKEGKSRTREEHDEEKSPSQVTTWGFRSNKKQKREGTQRADKPRWVSPSQRQLVDLLHCPRVLHEIILPQHYTHILV